MGKVQLSESEVDGMAAEADDVADDIGAARTALADVEAPSLEGFDILSALSEVEGLWESRLTSHESKWDNHAADMRRTADNVVDNDDTNAWYLAPETGGF